MITYCMFIIKNACTYVCEKKENKLAFVYNKFE